LTIKFTQSTQQSALSIQPKRFRFAVCQLLIANCR